MASPTDAIEVFRATIGTAVAARHGAPLGMTAEELIASHSRDPAVCLARKRLFAELRDLGWSYPMIGRFTKRDQSTIQQTLKGRRGASMGTKEMPLDDYNDGPLTPSTHGALVNEERTHDAGVSHGRWLERQTICRKLLARAAEGKMSVDTEHTLRKLAALIESGEL
jgi:hypothetical protein